MKVTRRLERLEAYLAPPDDEPALVIGSRVWDTPTRSSKCAGLGRPTFGDDPGHRGEHSESGVTRAGEYYYLGVRHNQNHLAGCSAGKRSIHGGGSADEMRFEAEPLLVSVAEAVQEINHGIVPVRVTEVARREVNRYVAVGRIAFEVPFEGFSVDLNALYLAMLGGVRLGGQCDWADGKQDE